MELNWVDRLPEYGEEKEGWPHETFAAMARAHAGKWVVVPGLVPSYAGVISGGEIIAYRPAGDYAAFSRDGAMYIAFVGDDPSRGFKPKVFPAVKVAIVDADQLPEAGHGQHAFRPEVARVADAMREHPWRWLEMPLHVVSSPNVITQGMNRVFTPVGAFVACMRGGRVYARFVGAPPPPGYVL